MVGSNRSFAASRFWRYAAKV